MNKIIRVLVLFCVVAPAVSEPIKTIEIKRPQTLSNMNLGGRVPIVHMEVLGKVGSFLLDTGSTHVVLSDSFVAELRVNGGGKASGRDSTGQLVKGFELNAVIMRSVESGDTFNAKRPLSMSLPPLEKLGLAGVVSPQSFIGDGCVVIDFKNNVVRYSGRKSKLCFKNKNDLGINSLSESGVYRPIVTARLGSHENVPFLLDTGASTTSVNYTEIMIENSGSNYESRGVSGLAKMAPLLGPSELHIGSETFVLDKVAWKPNDPVSKLGMDLLGESRIILFQDGFISIHFGGH